MFFPDSFLKCKYINQCSGCQLAHLEKSQQIEFKINHFTELWKKTFNEIPQIDFVRPLESKFRDKMDLTIQHDAVSTDFNIEFQKIGFYKKDSRDILDIDDCPLATEKLSQVYKKLRKVNFPIQKGSLRLRLSPTGKSGLWLDFSNEDIKNLLDEKSTLEKLTKIFDVIEIGQKRKKLTQINGQFKLVDPELNPWFETYDRNLNAIPLHMHAGGFSQTGCATNKILISELVKILQGISLKSSNIDPLSNYSNDYQNWLELCSGSGNLTFPLLSLASKVVATELDESAVSALKQTAKQMDLSDKLQVERINIHKPSEKMRELLVTTYAVLADPPRSGLQGFLEVITGVKTLPKNFVYVSCFAETLISDFEKLSQLGYKVKRIVGVDQFPHSTHCEWILQLSTL